MEKNTTIHEKTLRCWQRNLSSFVYQYLCTYFYFVKNFIKKKYWGACLFHKSYSRTEPWCVGGPTAGELPGSNQTTQTTLFRLQYHSSTASTSKSFRQCFGSWVQPRIDWIQILGPASDRLDLDPAWIRPKSRNNFLQCLFSLIFTF